MEVSVNFGDRTVFSASLTQDQITGDWFMSLRNMPPDKRDKILEGMPFQDLGDGLWGCNLSELDRQANIKPPTQD